MQSFSLKFGSYMQQTCIKNVTIIKLGSNLGTILNYEQVTLSNPLKYGGNYVYHLILMLNGCILFTQFIYGLYVILRINSYCLLEQH